MKILPIRKWSLPLTTEISAIYETSSLFFLDKKIKGFERSLRLTNSIFMGIFLEQKHGETTIRYHTHSHMDLISIHFFITFAACFPLSAIITSNQMYISRTLESSQHRLIIARSLHPTRVLDFDGGQLFELLVCTSNTAQFIFFSPIHTTIVAFAYNHTLVAADETIPSRLTLKIRADSLP